MTTSYPGISTVGITTVRLDPELRDWLDSYARATNRSRNGAVNHLIQEARQRSQQEVRP